MIEPKAQPSTNRQRGDAEAAPTRQRAAYTDLNEGIVTWIINQSQALGGGSHSVGNFPHPRPGVALSQDELWSPVMLATAPVRRIPVATLQAKRAILKGKAGTPRCLTWRMEGDRLLCGLASGEVATYSATTLECEDMKRILAASGDITAICALGSADSLIFGDSRGKLVFVSKSFAPQQSVPIYSQQNAVYAIEPSPNDVLAVVGVKAAIPVLMDLTRYQTIGLFNGVGFEASCIHWHPRRNIVAAGSRTHQLQLWDPKNCVPADSAAESDEKSVKGVIAGSFAHRGSLTSVRWHPFNDFILLTCARDQLICMWDIRRPPSGGGDAPWNPFEVHKSEIDTKVETTGTISEGMMPLSFSSGISFVDKFENHGVRRCPDCYQAFNTHNFNRMGTFDWSRVWPTTVDWHPLDGGLFVTGDSAGMLTFWKDGERICRVDQSPSRGGGSWIAPSQVEALQWHPSGTMLASASGPVAGFNGTVNVWRQPDIWGPLTDTNSCAHSVHLAQVPDEEEQKLNNEQDKVLDSKRRNSLIVHAADIKF